jgi:pimeloyl-ACP methyl ester carboxylesterase
VSNPIRPFRLAIPDAELADLGTRIARVRFPEKETVADWSQGVPLVKLRALVDHWRHGYDWRRCESMLNGFGQYRTVIDGLDFHFLHIKSPHAKSFPLIMTHGWPGSVIEFHKVIGPLVDPPAHGGDAADAFDLVLPSLPGYGFSEHPGESGWGVFRIARAWPVLMRRLGYERYGAQGGDWGAAVTTIMGHEAAEGLVGIHVNMPLCLPDAKSAAAGSEEAALSKALGDYARWESGYAIQQATRPQTLGYALADSPVGQAAWIYEKFRAWTDCDGDPESVLSQDEMLDNIMLYWLSNSGASSARLYWESFHDGFASVAVDLPSGCSIFPKEIYTPSRKLAERHYRRLIYWNKQERGGHFAAFEQPSAFVEELRACFRLMR